MLRIGVAASKMAKDNLLAYNFFVILISTLFSLIVFCVCGFAILLMVVLLYALLHFLKPDIHTSWVHMLKICLIILGVVVGVFDLVAIVKNIQLAKK